MTLETGFGLRQDISCLRTRVLAKINEDTTILKVMLENMKLIRRAKSQS